MVCSERGKIYGMSVVVFTSWQHPPKCWAARLSALWVFFSSLGGAMILESCMGCTKLSFCCVLIEWCAVRFHVGQDRLLGDC